MSFLGKAFTLQLNTVGNKQHPCLTPLPVITFLVSLLSIFSLTLIHIQFVPVSTITFRICINLFQFTWSNAFCQSMKHEHNSSSMSKDCLDIILGIPVASLVPYPLQNLNWSSPIAFSIFLSIVLGILTTIFVVYVMRLFVLWSLHFLAVSFFREAVIVTWMKSLGHSPVSYMLVISCVIILLPTVWFHPQVHHHLL